ncbi:MAG TPA: hypothetical protein VGN81_42060 [Pseudonocardiaceae bacterium]
MEDALTSQDGVRDAAVVGVPDDRTGETVHAFVVGAVPARLPVPMTVHVVDALPVTALGKVDKRRLRERVLVDQLPLP